MGPFWRTWCLFAAALVVGVSPWLRRLELFRHARATYLVALGLLVAMACVAFAMRASSLRRHAHVVWWLALAAVWAVFWVTDLRLAMFQLTLGLVPLSALGFLSGAWIASGQGRWRWLGAPLVGVGVAGGWWLSSSEGSALMMVLAHAGLGAVFGDGVERTPGEVHFPAALSLGAALGLVQVWTLLVRRSDNGCAGVSHEYSATVGLTALALFVFGPWVFARPMGWHASHVQREE